MTFVNTIQSYRYMFHSVSAGVCKYFSPNKLLFSSTTSLSVHHPPLLLPLVFFVPRCSHSVILLLLSCAVCLSSLLCIPYSAMRRNTPGHWKNPSFVVTSARQVQWPHFILIEFTVLMQTNNCRLMCAFQANIWCNVWTFVKLCVHLVWVSVTDIPTTWSWPALFVKNAKDVSNFTAFLLVVRY